MIASVPDLCILLTVTSFDQYDMRYEKLDELFYF